MKINRRIRKKIWNRHDSRGLAIVQDVRDIPMVDLLEARNVRRFINLYECDKAFGGHEEGGWWFDCATPLKTLGAFRPASHAFAARFTEAERLAAAMNHGRHPISSVLSDGEVRVVIEPHPGKAYPERRPHYE